MLLTVASFFTFLYPQKEKGLFQHTVDNEVSASSMLTFYKNQLLIGKKESSFECFKSDFKRGNLCLVPVRRFPGLLGQFTTEISPGRTGGKRPTSSPGLSDPKRFGRPDHIKVYL